MRPQRPTDLLTTSEAGALLGISMDTVARMADAGEIRVVRTKGGHRRIPRDHVDAILRGAA